MSSADTTDAAPEAEVDEAREELVEMMRAEFGDQVVGSHIAPGTDVWVRLNAVAWLDAATFLQATMGFRYFNFLSAIDWMPSPFGRDMDSQVDLTLDGEDPKDPGVMEQGVAGGDTRFQVFARLNDVERHRAITLKADVSDDAPSIASLVPAYPGASWHEREAWEMFGIDFVGHPGLTHIYLPGEFEGNPLRKDYPLLARRVKPWPGIVDVESMPDEDDDEATSDPEVVDA